MAARKINLAKFRARKCRVLVVTDVAARGIDIPLLDNVINYDFPDKPKLFVHRYAPHHCPRGTPPRPMHLSKPCGAHPCLCGVAQGWARRASAAQRCRVQFRGAQGGTIAPLHGCIGLRVSSLSNASCRLWSAQVAYMVDISLFIARKLSNEYTR